MDEVKKENSVDSPKGTSEIHRGSNESPQMVTTSEVVTLNIGQKSDVRLNDVTFPSVIQAIKQELQVTQEQSTTTPVTNGGTSQDNLSPSANKKTKTAFTSVIQQSEHHSMGDLFNALSDAASEAFVTSVTSAPRSMFTENAPSESLELHQSSADFYR